MMSFLRRKLVPGLAGLVAALAVAASPAGASGTLTQGIVADVVSAPVVSNGLVAGAPTEFNIILNSPGAPDALALDPPNFGHQIPAGGHMEVILGGSFQRNPAFANSTGANALEPNRNVILTINPQDPITATAGAGVQHGNWSVGDNGSRTFTVTPNGGSGEDGLENARASLIGIKVIHLRPDPNDPRTTLDRAPFFNGPKGTVGTIEVKIFNADGSLREDGWAWVKFRDAGTQVHITNAGLTTGAQGSPATVTAETVESTHFQRVAPLTSMTNAAKTTPFSAGAPYALRFLLFDEAGNQPDPFIPQKGLPDVGYVVVSDTEADLVMDTNGNGTPDPLDAKIGSITLTGPGADAQILPNPALTTSGAGGAAGPNGSVLNVPVKAGSRRGIYRLTVRFDTGIANAATSFFVVVN